MLPRLSKLQYMLFDWDGTLADNRTAVINSVQQVLAEYHLPEWEQIKAKRNPRLSLWDNFTVFFGAAAAEAYNRYLQIYKAETLKTTKAFAGAQELLDFCRGEGIELMIMTNKDRRLLDIELPRLYNPDIFSRIVCGHEAPRDKPWPEHIFYTLRGLLSPLEITPDKVWMVGDSNQDSDCALAAHALPVRVNTPLFGNAGQPAQNVHYFGSFAEFLNALKGDRNHV